MKTRAIVLSVTRHSDSAVMAHLFTQHYGCMTFVARRGGRGTSPRGGVSAAMLQPLSQLEIECTAPTAMSGSGLQRLRGAELAPAYASIPFSPAKASIAMFLGEFLQHTLRGEQASEPLFEFIALSLQWLDGAEDGYANFHLIFLLRLTRYLGYDPTMLPEAQGLQVATLMRHNYRTMRLLPLNGRQRTYYLRQLVAFYRDMVPGFSELKSLDVLEQVFADEEGTER